MVKNAGYTNAVITENKDQIVNDNLYTLKRTRPGINVGEDLIYIIETQ